MRTIVLSGLRGTATAIPLTPLEGGNGHLLLEGDEVFGCEVLDVFDEFGGVDDFDVIGEADDETANATIVGDKGIEEPMRSVDLKDLILGKWVLLDKEAVGHDTQAKTDAEAVVACHAEDIDEAFAMRMAVLP